jgi:thiamine-monophosphate kinase
MCSGALGGSEAGLRILDAELPGFDEPRRRHLEPVARLDIAREVTGKVTAMEDVSDGLATEVQNICAASGVGAIIRANDIPVIEPVREAARALAADPIDWALFGGEDYELIYATAPHLARTLPGYAFGLVTRGRSIRLVRDGREEQLTRSGWDPFSSETR